MGKEHLIEIIKNGKSAPFLFLGSGFSRHYISSPDWKGILSKFSPKHINQYCSALNSTDYPTIASAIAKDVNDAFWQLPDSDDFKSKYVDKIQDQSSALKYRIAEYLRGISSSDFPEELNNEILSLQQLSVDGIITTNWDDVAERMFPSFVTYVGQSELISASTFSVGEIYKIHGCISQPSTMVLTKEDYDQYNDKNTYLAAKLITIFVEHPIVFMGYSLSDPNIICLLKLIVTCMSSSQIATLQKHLLFVDWVDSRESVFDVLSHSMSLDGSTIIPVTLIRTNNYKEVYECLGHYERTIPANLLRNYKKQFYQIVLSDKPERQLHVLSGDAIDQNQDIQVVYGFGAIEKFNSAVGYVGINLIHLYRDVIEDNSQYDPLQILQKTIPVIRRGCPTAFFPVYKYLSMLGIHNKEDYERNKLGINLNLLEGNAYQCYPSVLQSDLSKSVDEIIKAYPKDNDTWRAVVTIPYLQVNDSDLPIILEFIKEQFVSFIVKKNNRATFMKRLICFYDWKKYGW